MPLNWNEIKDRALRFSREWADEASEHAEAKSFWDGFFDVFGVPRRRVGTFERHVKKIDGRDGYIDLLWKGVLLVEHKSRGRDFDRTHTQARRMKSDYQYSTGVVYNPLSMPPPLVKAHQALDRAVDAAYGKRRFHTDADRVAFLFDRYQQLTSLLPATKPKRKLKKAKGTA